MLAALACVASGGYACLLPHSVLDTLYLPPGNQVQPVGQAITQLIWRKDYSSPALNQMRQILESASDHDALPGARTSSMIDTTINAGLNDTRCLAEQ